MSIQDELDGARETIAHMSEAMSWIAGHDRQGLDHLREAMEACRERDAAEAILARVRAFAQRTCDLELLGILNGQ